VPRRILKDCFSSFTFGARVFSAIAAGGFDSATHAAWKASELPLSCSLSRKSVGLEAKSLPA